MADINFDSSVLDAPNESAPTTDGDAVAETTVDTPTEGSVDVSSQTVSQPTSRSRSTQQESTDDSPYTEREQQLLARIEELSGRQSSASTQQDDTSPFQPQDHNFLDGLDMDEVLSSSDGLNNLLLAVYNKAIQEASRMSAENIMRGLPGTMSSYFNQQLTMRELVNKFYEDNSDLAGMKKTVAMVANEVANENPELTAEQVFEETGKRARKLLGVAEIQPKTTVVNGRERPTLHSNRSNGARQRVSVPELDGLAKEIHDLIT